MNTFVTTPLAMTECWLIDDKEEEHFIFKLAVKVTGLKITCKCHIMAEEALAELKANMGQLPAIIFLDVNMPRTDGFEFLEGLKAIEHLKRLPVFIYTSSFNMEDVKKTSDLKADGYIIKANSYKELAKALRTVLIPYLSK